MLVATDDPSFTGNVRRHVLDLIMELGVHVKGDRLKEKQFYVDAYQKMAPISCAVLQSASNPDVSSYCQVFCIFHTIGRLADPPFEV